MAFACTQRFQVVAEASQLRLVFMKFGDEDAFVRAPRESIDRLLGSWLTTRASSPRRGQSK